MEEIKTEVSKLDAVMSALRPHLPAIKTAMTVVGSVALTVASIYGAPPVLQYLRRFI